MGCTDPPTTGVGAPHQYPRGSVAFKLPLLRNYADLHNTDYVSHSLGPDAEEACCRVGKG